MECGWVVRLEYGDTDEFEHIELLLLDKTVDDDGIMYGDVGIVVYCWNMLPACCCCSAIDAATEVRVEEGVTDVVLLVAMEEVVW